jgi:hypothetical protein
MSGKEHFVVERYNWRPYESIGYRPSEKARRKKGCQARLPGTERMSCFDTLEEAEADCQRREAEARRGINPFACGGALCYLSSFDWGRLHDWVLDSGLSPPGPDGDWRKWWEAQSPTLTDLQKAKIWQALDKVRFFRVARASKRIVFVVAGAYWRYNDQYYYREDNGLNPYKAFRTREAAEEEREEMEEFCRDDDDWHPFQINGLCNWERWSSLSQEEAVERVKALGLPPPGAGHRETLDWENWWEQTDMDFSQREAVWDLLDKNRAWEVIEVEMPD